MTPAGAQNDASERYVGESRFLRLWPFGMLAFALLVLTSGGAGRMFFALAFAGCGLAVARLIPWRFVVRDDGLGLCFAFGRRLFLPKSLVTIRADLGGAVAHVPRRRLGYPLTEGLVERHRLELRAVFAEHGFRLA